MAVYHLTARIVARSKGQSAVHKAAYIARTQLHDERLGLTTRDYRDDEALLFSGIFTPQHAPAWTHDRAALWNRAEAAEKRKDAQVAREIEIALPYELTHQQREWLVKDFVREQFIRQGMIADVAIHAPSRGGDSRNYHAHILLTKRALDGEDFAAKKNRDWDTKEQLQTWRAAWSRTVNRHLERHGHAITVDHRTLDAQGLDREPGIHLGVHAAAMEARGLDTERGEHYRAITARNRMKGELTVLWEQADSGRAFKAAVEERGYVLAQGTLTEFCLVDRRGDAHGLARQIMGVSADDVRARMANVDRTALPGVSAAKAIVAARRSVMDEQERQNDENRKREELAKGEAEKIEAIGKEEQAKLEAMAKEEAQKKQALAEEQQRRDQYRKDEDQKQARAKELSDQQMQQQLDQQLAQLKEMQQRRALEDAWLAQRARDAEDAKRARQLEGDVTNAHGRYAQALGQHYDVRDPYGSLARSAMAEHARFMQERQTLDRQLAQEKDPEARKALELRKQIEAADYMALTDRRIASQSEIITGKLNSPEAIKSRERATEFEKEAAQLREQYREHQLAREQRRDTVPVQAEKDHNAKPEAEKKPDDKIPVTVAKESAEKGEKPVMVMDMRNGKEPVPLVDFVNGLPDRPAAQDARMQNLAQRREQQALTNISYSLKAGKVLDGDDVKHLPRRDLEQIRQKGDAHLRERARQHQQAKEQTRERTRERERER